MFNTLIESIQELTEPIIVSQGLELVDIEFTSESRGWVLRFYVDKEGGVTINHCSRLSEQLGDLIEVKDIIPHRYTLEVSSPGLNRVLKKEKDFLNHLGETVKVKTSQPIDQRRHFQGKLLGCREGKIIVSIDDQALLIPLAHVIKANISYQFPEPHRKKGKAAR